ncbi:MAG TPA: hypothetical protein VL737_04335, partial [Candidatus Pristimantibacillus sp.]|nr:hypothetical protein [Candidatus Pristimantibacillus sp.]
MSNNHVRWLRLSGVGLLLGAALLTVLYPAGAKAASGDDFNVQVSPSPMSVLLTPGQKQTANLTVRNLSSHSQTLVPRLNGFTIDKQTEQITLQAQVPLGLDKWISFSSPSLTLAAGGTAQLGIIYNTPSDVGFSYSLAITLSAPDVKPETQGATYKASVAVFNLININRSDAKRQLEIGSFKAGSSRYEYLPANFNLVIKNSGNVIDQPSGNLFIQRSFNDPTPIATIKLNPGNSYIL